MLSDKITRKIRQLSFHCSGWENQRQSGAVSHSMTMIIQEVAKELVSLTEQNDNFNQQVDQLMNACKHVGPVACEQDKEKIET